MVDLIALNRVVLLVAGVVLLGFAHRAVRARQKPVGRSFGALLGLLGVTAVCIGATAATGTANKLIWLFTNLSIPLALLAFSFDYYGIPPFASRARAAAVVTPAVLGLIGGILIIVGTPAKTPGMEAPLGAVATLPSTVFDLAATFDRVGFYYTAGVVVVAVGLVAVNVLRYEHLDTRLAALVAFIGAWPWFGNFLVPDISAAYGDVVGLAALSVGYTTSAVVAGLVIGPLGLLATSPAAGNVGPEHVLDSMDDAVLIADDRGRVLRLNAAACAWFETSEIDAVGRPLATVIGHGLDTLEDGGSVSLETVEGIRTFAVTRSPVTAGTAFQRGTVVVLRDVTDQQTREQRLAVLNRVLRHNLRNNATSIIGRAQLIDAGQADEDTAEKIVETTQNLVGAAENARDIEAMMAASPEQRTTDVAATIDRITTEIASAYPAVNVTTAVPAGATAGVSQQVFETVFSNLIENAAEHNDAAEPLVVVSADETNDGSLMVTVADNGPGIPEHEQAVLDAGQENQLQHGSGLGLWAVYWGVTQMGGTLDIGENEPRGTTVTMTIPASAERTAIEQGETESADESREETELSFPS